MLHMTAQAALKTALKDVVGPAARAHGFKGSVPTWRKSTPSGDWAVVNVQSSSSSSAEHVRCIINLAVAPAPWLAWETDLLGRGAPRSVTEYMGLYRDRLHPSGTENGIGIERWWDVYDDASAQAVAQDMLAQLATGGWPTLDRLLDRTGFAEQLATGRLGQFRRASHAVLFARAEALLLMDSGPSDQLEHALRLAREGVMPQQEENARAFDAWVRNHTAEGRLSNSVSNSG